MKIFRVIGAILFSVGVWIFVNNICSLQAAYGDEVQYFSECTNYRTTDNYDDCIREPYHSGCRGSCSRYLTSGQHCTYALTLGKCPIVPGTSKVDVFRAGCELRAGIGGQGTCLCPAGFYPYQSSYTDPDDASCKP